MTKLNFHILVKSFLHGFFSYSIRSYDLLIYSYIKHNLIYQKQRCERNLYEINRDNNKG